MNYPEAIHHIFRRKGKVNAEKLTWSDKKLGYKDLQHIQMFHNKLLQKHLAFRFKKFNNY